MGGDELRRRLELTPRIKNTQATLDLGEGRSGARDGRFPSGTLLAGRYRIVSLLGRGAMGEVYRADDLTLDSPVALKFLPAGLERDEERMARLAEEVRIARQVSHRNVCRVFDVAGLGSHPFLSMEYVDGEDLASLLRRIGRLPHDKAAEIGRELASGLAAIHRQGILHRDLKPANLMIDGHGHARITDFGVAGLAAAHTDADAGVGTPRYMAPEQLAGRPASVQTDLYAFGMVLYELLTGRRAFPEAGSLVELLRLREKTRPPSPSDLVDGLDPEVEALILRCLAGDPDDRPASAEAVVAALSGTEAGVEQTILVCEWVPGKSPAEKVLGALESRHELLVQALLDKHGGRQVGSGEVPRLSFEHPGSAVSWALEYHDALNLLSREYSTELSARIGIDLDARSVKTGKPVAAARLASVAGGGQTLLTRGAFDFARRSAPNAGRRGGENLRWLAHGSYTIEGVAQPIEVCEVGVDGSAPLVAPADSARARRAAAGNTILGWRPAPALELPLRPHWVLAEKLGEGGFGEVWLAVHRKTQERRVFKFCYEARSLRALQREITLFRLLKEELGDRADINRILDWNFEQAPYFIESEYTAGGNLVHWAQEQGGLQQVPLATRLELLAQIAEALAAAHSVGVLHKDVKPANVLITIGRDGTPRAKLTDFGIGQVTDRERLARAGITVLGMTATIAGMPSADAGTRLYMAPEVVEGKAATVEADIYALGVILYQLVVGDFSRAVASGWRRDVDDELLCEDIAVTVDGSPERRLGNARRLTRRLRALDDRRQQRAAERREREDRARELKEAELARAALERARKRRKLLAVVIAGLTFFAAAMVFQARRIAREAERANREAQRANREARAAQQVSEFLVGLFERTDPFEAQNREITLQLILDQGAEKIEQELDDQPAIQARLMNTIGVVYRNLGQYETAVRLIERAVSLRRQVFGEEHVEVAESLNDLGWLLVFKGDYQRAEPLLRQSLAMRRKLLGEDHLEVAESLHNLAGALLVRGAQEEAEAATRQALSIRRRLLGERDFLVVETQNSLGILMAHKGDYVAAERLYREVLTKSRLLLSEGHPVLARNMNNLATSLHSLGNNDDAERLHRQALEIWRTSFGEEHAELAITMANLASVLHSKGDDDEAEQLFREALAMARRVEGEKHPEVAARLNDLAGFLADRGEARAAMPLVGEAMEIYRVAFPESHWRIAFTRSVLGACLAGLGRYQEAEDLLLEAYRVLRDDKGERTRYARYAARRIVVLYEAWGREDQAAEYRAVMPPQETQP